MWTIPAEHHIVQISENRHVEKVFKNVRQKLNRSQNVQNLCVDLGMISVDNDESLSSSRARLQ